MISSNQTEIIHITNLNLPGSVPESKPIYYRSSNNKKSLIIFHAVLTTYVYDIVSNEWCALKDLEENYSISTITDLQNPVLTTKNDILYIIDQNAIHSIHLQTKETATNSYPNGENLDNIQTYYFTKGELHIYSIARWRGVHLIYNIKNQLIYKKDGFYPHYAFCHRYKIETFVPPNRCFSFDHSESRICGFALGQMDANARANYKPDIYDNIHEGTIEDDGDIKWTQKIRYEYDGPSSLNFRNISDVIYAFDHLLLILDSHSNLWFLDLNELDGCIKNEETILKPNLSNRRRRRMLKKNNHYLSIPNSSEWYRCQKRWPISFGKICMINTLDNYVHFMNWGKGNRFRSEEKQFHFKVNLLDIVPMELDDKYRNDKYNKLVFGFMSEREQHNHTKVSFPKYLTEWVLEYVPCFLY